MLFDQIEIISPKRIGRSTDAWEGFFPYYAGFPESFASRILTTSHLAPNSLVFDPWNGSGTTTYSASKLGYSTIGFDINPAMVVVGRARVLQPSEADSLLPLCRKILQAAHSRSHDICPSDQLLSWFGPETAKNLRFIEESIRSHIVGPTTLTDHGCHLENLSGIAATFYVALFSVCRSASRRFRSSNPTWFRIPRTGDRRISISRLVIERHFTRLIAEMSEALRKKHEHFGSSKIQVEDSTKKSLQPGIVDLVLTSPPYCTRIDYTAATRVELAVLAPLLDAAVTDLRSDIMGSIKVPKNAIMPSSGWGTTCLNFLGELRSHSSKASASYYHKTHLDYFDKLFRSVNALSASLKVGGAAIIVVQDSYYKDLHNDLAQTVDEMASNASMHLRRRDDFFSSRSMSGINGRSRAYDRPLGATESVLCFEKLESKGRQS